MPPTVENSVAQSVSVRLYPRPDPVTSSRATLIHIRIYTRLYYITIRPSTVGQTEWKATENGENLRETTGAAAVLILKYFREKLIVFSCFVFDVRDTDGAYVGRLPHRLSSRGRDDEKKWIFSRGYSK
ncbi:hypothetical protein GWI33_016608 [Rhynchophorus ferrugineus]|uniref:Uncharacterized protein n=1 Tax=Rhynchophorus ferrugineus TaxID=354439 RepID=A0A834I0X3_RHYFE|nr:hypothetical protein GWI33_016608 [Rhynchophorus ferrugineus]